MRDMLLSELEKQLNIPCDKDIKWLSRAIYSVAGRMALASLWDRTENGAGRPGVSPQHFKRRIVDNFQDYADIFPEAAPLFPSSREDLAALTNDIYDTYLRTGHIYHSAYTLAPCAPAEAEGCGVRLCRGAAPEEGRYMSGLGLYVRTASVRTDRTPAELFRLPTEPLDRILETAESGSGWTDVSEFPDGTEFLRVKPPYTRGYWQSRPTSDGQVSLARWGDIDKQYMLYRTQGGETVRRMLPSWWFRDALAEGSGGYLRMAAAVLHRRGTLPAIRVWRDDPGCRIRLDYLLPPEEQAFFKLYSWPSRMTGAGRDFDRIMMAPIYPIFRAHLESIGYTLKFHEEG